MGNEFMKEECLNNLYTPPNSSKILDDIEKRRKKYLDFLDYEANRTNGIVDRQQCTVLRFKAFREDDTS